MTTTRPALDGRAETTPRASEQGVGDLVKQASEQISGLVRAELRLAAAEMKGKGKQAGVGAGLFGGAGAVALLGAAALVACVIAALSLAMPVWLAALIVGVVLLVVAGAMAAAGRKRVNQAGPLVPTQALDSTRQDIQEIKERAHR
ncbi:phage holin family protein [Thermopolyspora sp. NPDC052614]|uniref:phage holin family protein n=1 Tax=Thermopolyspora sp. NPDC052614 TaxID=3155682 RepID=UPI003439F52A